MSERKKNVNPASCSGALKIALPFTHAVSYCFSPGQVSFFFRLFVFQGWKMPEVFQPRWLEIGSMNKVLLIGFIAD